MHFSKKYAGLAFMLVVLLLSLVYATAFRSQLRCYLLPYANLDLLDGKVYVEPDMDSVSRQWFINERQDARERVSLFFDTLLSDPVMVVGMDERIPESYGAGADKPGMSHITPFGTYVVLGLKGMQIDVIAHEWVHAELQARIGWWKRETQIPTWFEEGLAMQVDRRFTRYERTWLAMTDEGKNAPPLNELTTMKGFQHYTAMSPLLSYYTAYRAVKPWWEAQGPEGFNKFVEAIKSGIPFEEAFSMPPSK